MKKIMLASILATLCFSPVQQCEAWSFGIGENKEVRDEVKNNPDFANEWNKFSSESKATSAAKQQNSKGMKQLFLDLNKKIYSFCNEKAIGPAFTNLEMNATATEKMRSDFVNKKDKQTKYDTIDKDIIKPVLSLVDMLKDKCISEFNPSLVNTPQAKQMFKTKQTSESKIAQLENDISRATIKGDTKTKKAKEVELNKWEKIRENCERDENELQEQILSAASNDFLLPLETCVDKRITLLNNESQLVSVNENSESINLATLMNATQNESAKLFVQKFVDGYGKKIIENITKELNELSEFKPQLEQLIELIESKKQNAKKDSTKSEMSRKIHAVNSETEEITKLAAANNITDLHKDVVKVVYSSVVMLLKLIATQENKKMFDKLIKGILLNQNLSQPQLNQYRANIKNMN